YYEPHKIEKKWQAYWRSHKTFAPKDFDAGRKKFYHLVMFAYPSGDLHIGHWYNFAPADTYARFKFMQGFNVLSPFGFDAFGLPAENAAIKHKLDPAEWTEKNIDRMRTQIESIGPIYDWVREVLTNDPTYYKWTQWLFLQLYKKGLAYKTKALANWCPSCQTVLANEQVVAGHCERCETEVIQKEIDQWLFKITAYADKLLDGLEKLDWPKRTKVAQRNWIGRSEGKLIEFPIKNSQEKIKIFTTRPDTIKGVTYMVVAPEHSVLKNFKPQIPNIKAVEEYVEITKKKTERERQQYDKSGVDTGLMAINPLTNEEVPVWVADYVFMGYGTGAIMAVPAHDERDREFAKQNNLPIGSDELIDPKGIGVAKINYHIRDWLVSRQRYWGAPIPMLYCKDCGIQAVPENELPVELPKIKDYLPKGKPPLATASKSWLETKCPNCGGKATREVETIDTFVDSSWYFLRYTDPKNNTRFADARLLRYWCPVDIYIGGAEHTVLHLLYARFITKVLQDLGQIDFDEPFLKLRHQGTILGPDQQKMSKSRGNIIDPDEIVKKYGSDTVRMFLEFMGPYDQGGPWSPTGMAGIFRFLKRVAALIDRVDDTSVDDELAQLLEQTIDKVTKDLEALHFNTAIAALMIITNEFEKRDKIPTAFFKRYLQISAPFAPHLTEELWEKLGERESIFTQKWPVVDEHLIVKKIDTYIIQVNSKIRAKIEMPAGAAEASVIGQAQKQERVAAELEGRKILRTVHVPSRLVNFVVQ
ncbi:leucine--tRNA ligase, partial [Candidatus Berkelbacteria bacterium]|nr:leucine--tRNA ligase [Candidatus Berkelbacteria bacterium]